MPEARVTCPSLQQLSDYGLGKLPDGQLQAVAAHLEGCEQCRGRVEGQAPDSFIGRLRDAAPKDGTLLPASPARPKPAAAAPAGLPAELASSTKFQVLGKLGQGGMGAVWRAKHAFLDRLVAIKVMSADVVGHAEAKDRFLKEMLAAGTLRHKHIVEAYDAEQAGNLLFLVMECVEGVSLEQLVAQKGPLPAWFACRCVAQAAEGLQYAFEKGMVHRDVKPGNLMVTAKEKDVKILDFGLARLPKDQAASRNQTQFQTFMGTPEYVAPEQATDARSADTRADVYSLGCTLYFLLAGRPPFQRDTPLNTILAHLQEEPPPLAGLPAGLGGVVAKMLAKRPEDRYQTPREVTLALKPFMAAKKGAAGDSGAVPAARPEVGGSRTLLPADTGQMTPLPAPGVPTARPAPAAELPDFTEGGHHERPSPKSRRRRVAGGWKWRLPYVAAALGLLGAVLLAGVLVLSFKTAEGAVVVEIDQADCKVYVDGKDIDIRVPGEMEAIKIKVGEGKHELKVVKGGFETHTKEFSYRKGDKTVLQVRLKPVVVPLLPKTKPPTSGFEPLFNGKDLTGWKSEGAAKWSVDSDGDLVGRGPAGALFTDREDFGDFTLRVELSASADAEAYVGLRLRRAPDRSWWGMSAGVFGDGGKVRAGQVGTDFNGREPGMKRLEFKPGQPFTLVMRVSGPEVWVSTNGEVTAGVRYDAGRFPAGRLGLVLKKGSLKVGRVEIKEERAPAAAGGFVHLLKGDDLTGWTLMGPKTTKVSVSGGVLTAKNTGPRGYVDDLVTARADYQNFHLRYQFKAEDERAAEVRCRVDPSPIVFGGMRGYLVQAWRTKPADGKAAGAAQLSLGSRCREECPLATAALPELPADAWHQVEVIAEGERVRVLVNGKPALDFQDKGATFRRGAVALSFPPGTTRQFRGVEIKELPAPAGPAGGRRRWTHQAVVGNKWNERWGVFQHVKGKEWVESVTDHPRFARYTFKEVARTDDYVELERPGMVIRLHEGHAEAGPDRARLRRAYDGGWQDGWVALFNGKDLTGWFVEGGKNEDPRVKDGALVVAGLRKPLWKNFLLSAKEYGDYRLRFECQLEKGASTAVVVRGAKGETRKVSRGRQPVHPMLLLSDPEPSSKYVPGLTHWVASGDEDGPAPAKADFPAGEWNRVEMEVRGRTCKAWINGKLVTDLTLDEGNKAGAIPAGLSRAKGHVGFRGDTGTARFRNIEIKELSDTGKPSSAGKGALKRTRWRHDGGTFTRTEGGGWKEEGDGGRTFLFRETARTEEYVELTSSSMRDYSFRLYADKAMIRRGKNPYILRFNGGWKE